MTTMPSVSILTVKLHGEPIGTLTNLGGDRTIFALEDAYIANPNRPTLSLALKDHLGGLISDFKPVQTRLMPLFSNLLPEDPLRGYLAARAGVNSKREFFLLRALGRDLPGAVTVTPADGAGFPPGAGDGGAEQAGDGPAQALRFSLAGVQLKFSAVSDGRNRLTIPVSGAGGSWIVKLPSPVHPGVPETEFSMMTLAALIGMDVPRIDLVEIGAIGNLPEGIQAIGSHAYAIERFDRLDDGTAVHMEDFAQVFGVFPDAKYDRGNLRGIARVIAAEGGDDDIVEFIRRLTFNILIGNADMHLKNWSVVYPDKRHVRLSPAYDFVSTIPYIPGDATNMKISRAKEFSAFTADELAHLAVKASIPSKMAIDTARETVVLFREHWDREARNLPMSQAVRSAIEIHARSVPIMEELS
jgi:serine/threonine-protein kinase HipA